MHSPESRNPPRTPPVLLQFESINLHEPEISKPSLAPLPERPPALPPLTSKTKVSLGLLCLLIFICALNTTVLSTAYPTLSLEFHAPALSSFWTTTSFLLATTISHPLFTALSHSLSPKPFLLTSVLLLTAGSILSALSHGFTFLLTGRAIQGIGSGGVCALTYVILDEKINFRDRVRLFGGMGAVWCLGCTVGPIIGGFLAQNGWRWIFWLQVSASALSLVGIAICLRLKPRVVGVSEALRKIDWVRIIACGICLVGILIPLSWSGGVKYPWISVHTAVPLLISVFVAFILLPMYSSFYTIGRILPQALFDTRTSRVAYIATTMNGMALWSIIHYMPLYFEMTKNMHPLKTGVTLLLFTGPMSLGFLAVGVFIVVTGKCRPALWIGYTLAIVGTALVATIQPHTLNGIWIIFSLVPSIGFSIVDPALLSAVQASMPFNFSLATATLSLFRSLGQTLGVVIGGVIFQNLLKRNIKQNDALSWQGPHYAENWARNATSLVPFIQGLPKNQYVIRENITHAYVNALRGVWITMCVLVGVGAVMSLAFVKNLGKSIEQNSERDARERSVVEDVEMRSGREFGKRGTVSR